jgi:hypothetical protein
MAGLETFRLYDVGSYVAPPTNCGSEVRLLVNVAPECAPTGPEKILFSITLVPGLISIVDH